MSAVLRAKMRVLEVSQRMDEKGQPEQEIVKLTAVYSDDPNSENAEWSKYTPAADFNIHITNPGAFGQLSRGHEFYIDFIPVE